MGDGYDLFIINIKKLTGIDLSLYKEEQMKRRLTSLKNKYHAETFQDYFKMINRDQRLLEECLDRMTINVSGFFRNKQRWQTLESTILPDLISRRKGKLKVWSAACSTGEEPYTLAFILSRLLPTSEFEILATDIDAKVLQKAETGWFDARSFQECSNEDIHSYFIQEGEKFRIKPEYQRAIRFKKHNLLEDTYEKSFDLIVCRNVLIYFTEEAKNDIYDRFSNSLKPGGILFIGSTEQIFHPQSFQLQPVTTFFYQRMQPKPSEKLRT
ncbi:MAG: CheR family methyltransferase [Tuberibacillus sp.]